MKQKITKKLNTLERIKRIMVHIYGHFYIYVVAFVGFIFGAYFIGFKRGFPLNTLFEKSMFIIGVVLVIVLLVSLLIMWGSTEKKKEALMLKLAKSTTVWLVFFFVSMFCSYIVIKIFSLVLPYLLKPEIPIDIASAVLTLTIFIYLIIKFNIGDKISYVIHQYKF